VQDLIGKVALVTASYKGLGKGFAIALARRGADLVIHHRKNPVEAEQVAQEIQALGRKVLITQGDLSTVTTAEKIFAETLSTYGRIDIVVNNAGMLNMGPIVDTTEASYDDVFNVNTKTPFFIMKECAKHMADNGRVINVSSTVLLMLEPGVSVYAGSKAALQHFTRAFSKEVGHRGITVNVVAPGPVDTDMLNNNLSSVTEEVREQFKAVAAQVDDIVPAVEFLASPAAQWVTAQTIHVNGGLAA
ncbi:hypothetical protein BGZ98_002872, partial [Dissophora globulifera]